MLFHLATHAVFVCKPWLIDETFSSNIVFVAHNMGWLNEQRMFDETSNKVSLHNAFCVLPLKLCSDVTQIRFLIGCFFRLGLALVNDQTFAREAKCWMKMFDRDQTWEAI